MCVCLCVYVCVLCVCVCVLLFLFIAVNFLVDDDMLACFAEGKSTMYVIPVY